jgi:hypothetical protein
MAHSVFQNFLSLGKNESSNRRCVLLRWRLKEQILEVSNHNNLTASLESLDTPEAFCGKWIRKEFQRTLKKTVYGQ